jgi:1,4-dihydroxy-6-naphthoate synthase
MDPVTLGFSPCPNDTFLFYALVHRRVDPGEWRFEPVIEDVETLNRLARLRRLDVTKVSVGALPALADEYAVLGSGAALGFGCGPLLVARDSLDREALAHARIAVPGRDTTANLLLHLWHPQLTTIWELPYDEILPAVADGRMDAGVLIHEGRFVYPRYGLQALVDLGAWWETTTGLPVPLGVIVARKSLGAERLADLEARLRASLEYAHAHRTDVDPYVRLYAQELDPEVIELHLRTYMTEETRALSPQGHRAIVELVARARQRFG